MGSQLVPRLREEGHEVWGCDLQHSGTKQTLRADIANYRELEQVFVEVSPECVYHLAAEFGRINGEQWYEHLWRTNAIGTRNVLELAHRAQAQVVFASSSEIYGESSRVYLDESLSEEEPLFQPNEYALSKWVNEVQIKNFADRHDFPKPIICRFFNAYGPGEKYHDYRSVVALFCYRALFGEDFTVYRNYKRTFMFIDDFIPTLAAASAQGIPGTVYNIGGADYRAVEDLADLVMQTVGKGTTSKIQYLEQDEHNVLSKRPDISRAEAQLGHSPTVTLEQGVPLTVDWMRKFYGR